MKSIFWKSLASVTFLAASFGVQADIVYDNSSVNSNDHLGMTNGQLAGDQITLSSMTPVVLTNFSFEYYSPNTAFSGSVMANVQLIANDGPTFNGYATPGTVLLDTTPFAITTPYAATFGAQYSAVLPFNLLPGNTVTVPTNFTFVVSFTGLAPGDSVGVELYTGPTVGQNTPDYWFNNGGGWVLQTNSVPVNFGMQLAATVPEPSSVPLVLIGVAAMLGFVRFRRLA